MFCSQRCLTKAHQNFHLKECNANSDNLNNPFREEFTTLMLAIQRRLLESLAITKSVETLREILYDTEPKTIFDFNLNCPDDSAVDMMLLRSVNSLQPRSNTGAKGLYCQTIASHLLELDLEPLLRMGEDRDDLVEYTARLALISDRNCHALQNSTCGIDASGLFPFSSLFNHSCDPNVQQFLYENKLVFIAVKPIAKDSQLFITYR